LKSIDGIRSFVIGLLASGCQSVVSNAALSRSAPASAEPASHELIKLTIIGDSDIHGALDPNVVPVAFANGRAHALEVGGAETMSAYYQLERDMNPGGVVLVSAGDFFQGTLIANQFQGTAVIDVLNHLHYDAVAVGNHEFDYGPLRLDLQHHPKNFDPRGVLEARMQQAQFPFLSCNIIDSTTQQPPTWPKLACATLVSRRGIRIGLIGATTAETPNTTLPPYVSGLDFLPIARGLRRGITEARKLGAEVIIAVVHAGTDCKRFDNPMDSSSCDLHDELPVALQALGDSSLDAVVAGHTHGHVAHFMYGMPVIESGAHGLEFGRVTLYLDPTTHRVIRDRTQIAQPQSFCREVVHGTQQCNARVAAVSAEPVVETARYLGKAVMPDPRMSKLLSDYRHTVQVEQARVIARIDEPIRRAPFGESALGDLITDCMLAATRRDPQIPDADFAIENSGGIRADILAGPLTFGALYEVLPFDNVLVTASLTGAQVQRIFDLALTESSRIFQVSGLRVTYSSVRSQDAAPPDIQDSSTRAYRVARVEFIDGKPLVLDRTYTIVWNDFLASGGNGMKRLVAELTPGLQTYHYGASLRGAVEDAIKANPSILADYHRTPKRPRIVFQLAQSP
jgi:5'-nucleotidase